MLDDDYGYDEGSDIDNWENEQIFQDHEGDDFADEDLAGVDDAESLFRDEYEAAFGTRPVFPLDWLTIPELLTRIENLQNSHAANRFFRNS